MITANIGSAFESKARRELRTNLFAMGTIYVDGASTPVRVRNLSPTGAMIEGAVLPRAGRRVRLRRGDLEVSAEIAWCKDGAAGLRFESAVTVAEWLPRGRAIGPQQRIDEVFHQARAGASVPSPPQAPHCSGNKRNALDLTRLKQAIESLAVELASDPEIVGRYASKLQVLDMAAETLGKIASER